MKSLESIIAEVKNTTIKDFFIHKPSHEDVREYSNTMAGIDTMGEVEAALC